MDMLNTTKSAQGEIREAIGLLDSAFAVLDALATIHGKFPNGLKDMADNSAESLFDNAMSSVLMARTKLVEAEA